MMKQANYWLMGMVLLLITACALVPKPQSLSEQIAYSYGVVASVRTSAAGMLTRGQLTVAQAKSVQAQADVARKGLDQARATLASGLPQDAQGQLLLATQVLTALENYLKTQSKGVN
jgi:hypothetical protein